MIGILGSGSWGTALAANFARAGKKVTLWSRNKQIADGINQLHENKLYLPNIKLPTNILATDDLQLTCHNNIVLLVVPSQQLSYLCDYIKANCQLSKDTALVICAKGIEQNSLKLLSDIVLEFFPQNPVAVLSGPNFADEIARGLPSGTSIACNDKDTGMYLVNIMGNNLFRTYYVKDIIGAQIGGAVKNVLAIACGICEGKNLGQNAKATLITRGIAEIGKICEVMGGNRDSLMFLCGIGDIILTCTSSKSRNMSLGIELGMGKKLDEILAKRQSVVEGVTTAKSINDLAIKFSLDLPICKAVNSVLTDQSRLNNIIYQLMNRPFIAE